MFNLLTVFFLIDICHSVDYQSYVSMFLPGATSENRMPPITNTSLDIFRNSTNELEYKFMELPAEILAELLEFEANMNVKEDISDFYNSEEMKASAGLLKALEIYEQLPMENLDPSSQQTSMLNSGNDVVPVEILQKVRQMENTYRNSFDPNAPIPEYIESKLPVTVQKALHESSLPKTKSYARSLSGCIPLPRLFHLELSQPLAAGEKVALVGDDDKLGNWQIDKALDLKQIGTSGLHYYIKLSMCLNKRLHYRYFIYITDALGQKRIRSWEAQQHARVLEKYQIFRHPGVDEYGNVYEFRLADENELETAWLRNEYVIELKFVWHQHMFFESRRRNLKGVKPIYHLMLRVEGISKISTTDIEVSHYEYNSSQFRTQAAEGEKYSPGDIMIFRLTESVKTQHTYVLLIMDENRHALGEVTILSLDLKGSEGVLSLPIVSMDYVTEIGQISLPYVIIRPWFNQSAVKMRASFHRYWPLNWPTMDIGHRGSGSSFYSSEALYVENTVQSLLFIQHLKGDMVQINVQMTADYVPVLWQDYGFYTAPFAYKVESELDLTYVLIKDLTYKQLKDSRVFIKRHSELLEYTNLNTKDSKIQERIFPKLSEVYKSLNRSMGIIVEIKWPQLLINNAWESSQSLDKNKFVNTLITTTVRHGNGRPIIFASFETDICTMLRLKQPMFPVIFMTTGESKMWESYKDLRTRSFIEAVNFVQSESILGTASHAGEFLNEPNLLYVGFNLGQAVFLWGIDLNNAKNMEILKNLEISGLIYDEMELNRALPRRWGFFEAKELQVIFERQIETISDKITIT